METSGPDKGGIVTLTATEELAESLKQGEDRPVIFLQL